MRKILHRLPALCRAACKLTGASASFGAYTLSLMLLRRACKMTSYGDADDILTEAISKATKARPFFLAEMQEERENLKDTLKS